MLPPFAHGTNIGPNLGADEVVRATGAEVGQFFSMGGIHKLEHIGRVAEARNPTVLRAHAPAQIGCDLDCQRLPVSARGHGFTAEARRSLGFTVTRDELPDLIDDGDGVQVALALGLSPGEEAVATEYDAIAAGMVTDGVPHHEAKIESGALPWNPDQRVVVLGIELIHLYLAVGRGGQGNTPVGMQMVDMREGQKAVQGRVDGCGDGIVAEGAHRIHRDHVVFGVDALVAALEGKKFLLVEGGEAAALHAAKIAAGAFYPDHFDLLAGERIGFRDLGTRVAARKIGNAQVRAEQVGAVAQQFRLVELGGNSRVPAIL